MARLKHNISLSLIQMTHPRVSHSLPCTVLEGTQHSLHTFHKGNFLNVISYKRNGEIHMNLRKLIFLYREEISTLNRYSTLARPERVEQPEQMSAFDR